MGTIFAIGGGDFSSESGEILSIELLKYSKKTNPKILFIPTASKDNISYINEFKETFTKLVGCEIDTLTLINSNYTKYEIENKIFSSDIIYVGGGDTNFMLSLWRIHGIDKMLVEAYDRGILLAGYSAGAVCWFDFIQSGQDSYESESNSDQPFKRLDGLGLIRGYACSHFNQKSRNSSFQEMIYNYKGEGFGICDNSALIYKDGYFKVITTDDTKGVYKVVYSDSFVKKMKLQLNIDFYNYLNAVDRS